MGDIPRSDHVHTPIQQDELTLADRLRWSVIIITVAVVLIIFGTLLGVVTDQDSPEPDCNFAEELWDGEQCVSRADHEAHMGD